MFNGNGLNNRGIALIVVMVIMAIVAILAMAILPQAVNERQFAEAEADSVRAFYAAESGINRALNDIIASSWASWDRTDPDLFTLSPQPLVDGSGSAIAFYEAEITNPASDAPVAEATGYCPTLNGLSRSIRVVFSRLNNENAAIIAKGSVDIKGNANVSGVREFSEFYFESAFGDTIENVKNDEDTEMVIDPPNNYGPVPRPAEDYDDQNGNDQYDDGEPFTDENGNGSWDNKKKITWFKLENNTEAMIATDGWSGSGIIVVEGGDLKITGGDFYGAIWVLGNLFIAGNATIDGIIFVDGTVEDITTITGTPVITYSEEAMLDAFDGINPLPLSKLAGSWREIYK